MKEKTQTFPCSLPEWRKPALSPVHKLKTWGASLSLTQRSLGPVYSNSLTPLSAPTFLHLYFLISLGCYKRASWPHVLIFCASATVNGFHVLPGYPFCSIIVSVGGGHTCTEHPHGGTDGAVINFSDFTLHFGASYSCPSTAVTNYHTRGGLKQ